MPGKREELTTWERDSVMKLKIQKQTWSLHRWTGMRVPGDNATVPVVLEWLADKTWGPEPRALHFILCREVPGEVRAAFMGRRQEPGAHAWAHLQRVPE